MLNQELERILFDFSIHSKNHSLYLTGTHTLCIQMSMCVCICVYESPTEKKKVLYHTHTHIPSTPAEPTHPYGPHTHWSPAEGMRRVKEKKKNVCVCVWLGRQP